MNQTDINNIIEALMKSEVGADNILEAIAISLENRLDRFDTQEGKDYMLEYANNIRSAKGLK